MPTNYESMTVCEDEGCVEGSAISPGTVYYVHAFMTSIEGTWINRTKSYLTHGKYTVLQRLHVQLS